MERLIHMQFPNDSNNPIFDGRVHEVVPIGILEIPSSNTNANFYLLDYIDRSAPGHPFCETVLVRDRNGFRKLPLTDYENLEYLIVTGKEPELRDLSILGNTNVIGCEQFTNTGRLHLMMNPPVKENPLPPKTASTGSPVNPPNRPLIQENKPRIETYKPIPEAKQKDLYKPIPSVDIYKDKAAHRFMTKDKFNELNIPKGNEFPMRYLPGIGHGNYLQITKEQYDRIRSIPNLEIREKEVKDLLLFIKGINAYLPEGMAPSILGYSIKEHKGPLYDQYGEIVRPINRTDYNFIKDHYSLVGTELIELGHVPVNKEKQRS